MKQRYVIFDMDGLMFDTEKIGVKAWDYAGERLGIGKVGYMVFKTLGMNQAATSAVWVKEFGDRVNQEERRKYTTEFFDNYYAENGVPVKKGLYVLLEFLKQSGYKAAVASSSRREVVEHHIKDAGVADYFEGIVCGDMVQKSKPEPDIYLRACELLGAKPEECYALEDSRSGLHSAYRAGCKVIMVPDLWEPDEETEKILFAKVKDLEQVKELLSKV